MMFLSVSFIQMLKALMPVAVYGTGCAFGLETFSTSALTNMVLPLPPAHAPRQTLLCLEPLLPCTGSSMAPLIM